MFENLADKLSDTFKRLKGHGKLTEKNIQDALKDVRMSFLEADVNFKVVKQFTKAVTERALGEGVLKSLTPGQQFVKIVHEELAAIMGEKHQELQLDGKPPVSIMVVGLQGSGKTTSLAKLAAHLKKKGRRPFLVPGDVYRPAAIDQLKTLARQLDIPVWDTQANENPVLICQKAKAHADHEGFDTLLIDTAGRLHIDQEMMAEVRNIKEAVGPAEILFVADAMTGQDAVNVAEEFHKQLDFTGVILTKMDGDARGGAALSIKAVTGKPIKFVGVGEKLDAIEPFHPERMAGRILNMGDVMTLVEKAQAQIDEKEALELERKLRKNEFTLEDFRNQLETMRKMGPLDDILGMIPGMGNMKALKGLKADESELTKIVAIINSMTPEERRNHGLLNGSRRRRVAGGSGTSIQDVNNLIKQYVQAKKMISKMTGAPSGKKGKGKGKGKKGPMMPKGMKGMFPFG